MSNLFQLKNSDLFIELSEQEQENVAGGFGLSSLLGFEQLFFRTHKNTQFCRD